MGWGARFSDDVNHIMVGVHHGCCSRVVARGLEMRVLDGVNARSCCWFWVWILFQGSAGLDSRMGTYLWDLCLDKYTGDGRFDGGAFFGRLLIFFLGGAGKGKRKRQDTYY